jgi:hypothetical protein
MKKKALVTIFSTAMVLSLTACGSQSAEVSEDVTTSEVETGATSETETTEAETQVDLNLVYGTATLTYGEFYSGDVSDTDSFDVVSSATYAKYEIFPNMDTDFVDETTNADGYHITGVKNVYVAVDESDLEAYKELNPTFETVDVEPSQYKIVTLKDGNAVYSETQFNVVDTITDATAELVTGGNWGDYQINVSDGETVHLRNAREGEFDIDDEIQGIILETSTGLKVGMEYLQSIWVQPYEVSWNVIEDNSHNTHIAAYDNLTELSKLVGETVVKITYIMPEESYVYELDGVYIKPIYSESITATSNDDFSVVTLSADDFSEFENGKLTVTYTLGSGKNKEAHTLLETELTDGTGEYETDLSEIANLDDSGIYSAVISSDTYADIAISLPASNGQRLALESLVAAAQGKLGQGSDDEKLNAGIEKAQEMLSSEEDITSDNMGSLVSELTNLTSDDEGNSKGGKH